jgi:hypothetical protein
MTTSTLEELPVNKTMLGSPVVEGNIVQLNEEKKKKNKKKNNSDSKHIREAHKNSIPLGSKDDVIDFTFI